MVIFAALFILLFITVLFGHNFLPRIKDFLQAEGIFSPTKNVDGGIRGSNTEAWEEVLETLTPSPSSDGSEFEVFLSFRGEDTRKRFIGHLYEGLEDHSIPTFIDSEKLKKGEGIDKLLKYIKRSKIFVPIFSKRFAESKWCLKEVTKSVECGKEIIPVFFGVEPSDVRNQSGPFKSAFKVHQSNKKQDQEEVKKWREALKKVGNLSGFTLKDMNGEQLDALAGGRDWFGLGSVIIVTTRDEEVLLAYNVKQDEIYKPQELNEDQSRELFMLHAFNGEQPQGEYAQLSNEVVAAAGGLPLTLEVIGSLLSSKKNVQEWKDTLEKLKRIPPCKVQQRLKLSYDSLDNLEKKIFLDISCFLIGKNRENATYMWEGCDWFPNAAVRILEQRSLVKIDGKYEKFKMHDQIRDMGRAIVDEECSQKLQKKSRLWNKQDSWDLLRRKGPGTIDAEGIQILQKDKRFNENDCKVSAECFGNMPNLRYLQAENVNFQGTFPCFPTDLKWLELSSCHFDSLPSDFNLEKLVILDLCETNMTPILINQQSLRLKAFERLKVLSLCGVETKIALHFMNMPSLVKLQFLVCSGLSTIDESIGKLKNLTHLSTFSCRLLQKLPDSIWRLSSLEVLNISGCFNVSSLPERLGDLGSLKKLDLRHTCIKKLPDSICRLSSIEKLRLQLCLELFSIPEGLGDMESLKKINLSMTCIEVIPDSIGQLTDLVELSLCNLESLDNLPDSICQLNSLKSLNLRGCLSLCSLPERLGDMEKLEELILDDTRIEIIPDSVGQLKSLRLLSLQGCKLLKALPISIRQLSSIQQLKLSGTSLKSFENDLPHLAAVNIIEFTGSSLELLGLCDQIHKALEILHLNDAIIEELPDCVGRMENLKELRLECEILKKLPNRIEGYLENLTKLEVRSMHLKALPDSFGSLKHIWRLTLKCPNLEILPVSTGELKSLAFFEVNSHRLKYLPNSIGLLKHIYQLELKCPNLEILPDSIGELESLTHFEVDSHRLKCFPNSIGSLTRIWFLIINCKNLEDLPNSMITKS
ncbi:disease resistance protein RUN1-like isoform X2 [Nymphaea colorata]|uniref:disease resistance protein RUN1-like isoform X2 n=1 Tax=Nymphaea colorata TaxID=210225 RepID=UPI00129DFAC0|nr:disease resistance protein RUN1-like isoform X2 [Nymphaea colorata]